MFLEFDWRQLSEEVTKNKTYNRLSDGTIRLIEYEKIDTDNLVSITDGFSYLGLKRVEVRVDYQKLLERKVLKVIYIMRTSKNYYKAIIENDACPEEVSGRTLQELSKEIEQFL